VRFFQGKSAPERLLWSRDIRFATRLAQATPGARVLELESGMVVIGPASELTDTRASSVAELVHSPPYGLVDLDPTLDVGERHLAAMAEAVQLSGLADRIGMSPSSQLVQMKTLDYFFSLRNLHQVAFQPIVELVTGRLHEYECLFRPSMPMLPQSISAIVHSAIDTGRSVELDTFIVRLILARAGEIEAQRQAAGEPSIRIAINFTPATLLAAPFEAKAFVAMVQAAGLSPKQITLECTEEQAVPDVDQLKRQVKTLRRLGFGFAVDDAGAGYASFALIAALRPSIIKIDRLIAAGVARDDAKQALVEAFVSFGRRIGARLLAEGIERRADLSMLSSLGVELGQGYLIGRPSFVPQEPRPFKELRPDRAGRAGTVVSRRVRGVVPKRGQRPAGA
jgi:EAL domain-containing protein (putative c-di-GMP-specific phosphodiesterase class I)